MTYGSPFLFIVYVFYEAIRAPSAALFSFSLSTYSGQDQTKTFYFTLKPLSGLIAPAVTITFPFNNIDFIKYSLASSS